MWPDQAQEVLWARAGSPDTRYGVDVVRMIDGDTFEARVHLWPGLEMTTRVRLRGIDAPEMKGSVREELRMAEAATEALRAQLADGDVAIFNIGPDKYDGRVVADAATRRTPSVSNALLARAMRGNYQGGKRGGWCERRGAMNRASLESRQKPALNTRLLVLSRPKGCQARACTTTGCRPRRDRTDR